MVFCAKYISREVVTRSILSVKTYNLYGNILTGLCAILLSVVWLVDKSGLAIPPAALRLLVTSGSSFLACISRNHEASDEMAYEHEGLSSSIALKALLLVCGALCCQGIITRNTIDLAPACCLCIGFGLVVYSLAFAVLERS